MNTDWDENATGRLQEALLDDLAGTEVYENRWACCWFTGASVLLALLLLSIVIYLIGKFL